MGIAQLGVVFIYLNMAFCMEHTPRDTFCWNHSKVVTNLHDTMKGEPADRTLLLGLVNCTSDQRLDTRDEDGNTPLLLAALYGMPEVFEAIQTRNISFSLTNNLGENVLHQAVIGGDLDILDSILQRNEISINSHDNEGNTAMHFVTMKRPKKNIIEICQTLLNEGGTANLKNNIHLTPFHIVLNDSSPLTVAILKAILEIKKDGYDIQDDAGRTPLQISLEKDYKEVFDLFIKHNANPYYTDFNGKTVIHHSVLKEYGLAYLETVLHSNRTFRGEANRIIPPSEGLNIKDVNGYTALHLAAEHGLADVFDILFDQPDIAPATANVYEETTLISSVKGGLFSIVEKLVNATSSHPSFINKQNKEGTTALHMSVEKSRSDVIEILLNNSADPYIPDLNELNPIALSASYGTLEIVELFADYDYNVTEMLALSVSNGNDENVIKYFLENEILANLSAPYQMAAATGMDIELTSINITNTTAESYFSNVMNSITKDHQTILTELAEDDEDETSDSFISEHSLINIALFFQGSLSTIKILMNRTESVEMSPLDSNVTWSPMDIASFRNKIDIVEYFLELDSKLINRVDIKNQTAMHKAAWGGHCQVLEYFHKNRSSDQINLRDMFGRTPLHIAAMRGYTGTVQCILQMDKESLNIRDQYEFTPLHLAEIYGHHKFFTDLQYVSNTLPSNFRYKMRYPGVKNRLRNHTATIELLLRMGADPNAQDKTFGWTALHWAAASGDLEVVKMLVQNEGNRARVNIPSHSDHTPLYLARFWGRRNVYEYLKAENAVW